MSDEFFDLKIIELENGLKIATVKKQTELISINMGIKIGALYEQKFEKGISHFIEHMLFKGTKLKNNEKLNNALENLGGDYNAYTDYTGTVYSIDCLKEEIENAIEILGEMLISSIFDEKELERERGVVLSEFKSSKDDIEDLSFKNVNEQAFFKSGLKTDVLGEESFIKKCTREDLIDYYNKYYVPNNTIITIVSSYEHKDVQDLVKKYFALWKRKDFIKPDIIIEKNKGGIFTSYKKDMEQSTITYLYTFYGLSKEEELSLRILNNRLGESANSILFRELREKRGLAYDVYTHIDSSEYIKTLYIYTAVEEENLEKALKNINNSIDKIKNRKIKFSDETLNLIKKVFKTSLVCTLEDIQELGNYILIQIMEEENIYEFLNDMKRLENMDSEHIYNIAKKVLNDPTIHILTVEKSETSE